MASVPGQYKAIVNEAVAGTGLAEGVVVAQIDEESGFQPDAVSSAGALGMFQFLPSTYTGLGFQAGTETDPNVEVKAYIKYMNALLSWAGGNVRKALAAYNAGQGNWQAGLGYADTILSNAGQPTTYTAGGGSSSGSGSGSGSGSAQQADTTGFDWTIGTPIAGLEWAGRLITGVTGSFGSIGDVAKSISGLVQTTNKLTEIFLLLFRPEFWLRVGAFLLGLLSLGGALYFLKESLSLWLATVTLSALA
jgi:hypothetical protein